MGKELSKMNGIVNCVQESVINNQSINHIDSAQWSITDQIYTKKQKRFTA